MLSLENEITAGEKEEEALGTAIDTIEAISLFVGAMLLHEDVTPDAANRTRGPERLTSSASPVDTLQHNICSEKESQISTCFFCPGCKKWEPISSQRDANYVFTMGECKKNPETGAWEPSSEKLSQVKEEAEQKDKKRLNNNSDKRSQPFSIEMTEVDETTPLLGKRKNKSLSYRQRLKEYFLVH